MKRFLFLAFALLLLPVLPVAAQDDAGSEVFVQQAGRDAPAQAALQTVSREDAMELLYDRLTGQGRNALDAYLLDGFERSGHFALVTQEGTGNTALVDQEGARNLAVMVQQGTGNTTRLWQQGTGNIYGSFLEGSNNLFELTQAGTNNLYLYALEGSGHTYSTTQIGHDLVTIQIGAAPQPLSVQQIGSGMQVIIEHH